jgi:hypothetical protein
MRRRWDAAGGEGRGRGLRIRWREGRKRFFFEKKKQKTFVYLGALARACQRPQEQKFFGSFFQKRTFFG